MVEFTVPILCDNMVAQECCGLLQDPQQVPTQVEFEPRKSDSKVQAPSRAAQVHSDHRLLFSNSGHLLHTERQQGTCTERLKNVSVQSPQKPLLHPLAHF